MDPFNNNENQGGSGDDPNSIENYLEHLVGDDKKFKSAEELAKGKHEADVYINTLTRKLDDLQAELDKRQTATDVADQIRKELAELKANNSSNQQQNLAGFSDDEQNQGRENNTENQKSFSEEDVQKLVEQQLKQRETQTQAERNINEVSKVLEEKVGATSPQYVETKAKELGTTVEALKELAAKSPKLFLRAVDLEGQSNNNNQVRNFTPPSSSVQTSFTKDTSVRNKAYYDNLYKNNPHLRLDAKTTIQEQKDALRLGDAFLN